MVGAVTASIASSAHQLLDVGKINAQKLLKDTAIVAASGFIGGRGATFKNKVMARQRSRSTKHCTSGFDKSVRFAYKMTSKYSRQFIGSTLSGFTRGFGSSLLGHRLLD